MTKGMLKALRWFDEHGAVSLFGMDAPSRQIRRRLEAAGLIEIAQPRVAFGFIKFQISDKGRAELAILDSTHERNESKCS